MKKAIAVSLAQRYLFRRPYIKPRSKACNSLTRIYKFEWGDTWRLEI